MGRGYYTLETRKSSAEYFFFFFLFGESIYHPPLILMKGKATPPVLYPPTSPKVSGRLDARSKISTFSHHLFPGVMRAAILFVSLSYLLCVCVDIKSSAWQTQAQDGRRDSVVPNFSQTRPMRLTPSVTECFLRPTWTEIKRNK